MTKHQQTRRTGGPFVPTSRQLGEADGRRCRHELNDEDGQDEAGGGQAEHHNTEHTCKGGHRVDAVDETEVSEHVEKQGSETLDVR